MMGYIDDFGYCPVFARALAELTCTLATWEGAVPLLTKIKMDEQMKGLMFEYSADAEVFHNAQRVRTVAVKLRRTLGFVCGEWVLQRRRLVLHLKLTFFPLCPSIWREVASAKHSDTCRQLSSAFRRHQIIRILHQSQLQHIDTSTAIRQHNNFENLLTLLCLGESQRVAQILRIFLVLSRKGPGCCPDFQSLLSPFYLAKFKVPNFRSFETL